MAELLDVVEAEFGTDYAMVGARQEGSFAVHEQSFATSEPGCISLMAGSKYPDIRMRAERWSARPPMIEGWEDTDELPFVALPGGGPLLLEGFDAGNVGLDVTELSGARVQVFARGRHRYSYSDDAADMAPEEWLLRLFPHDEDPDPLAGGPRRIAGEGGLLVPRGTPWFEAVLGLGTSGWSRALVASHGFLLAKSIWQGPCTRAELASRMVRGVPPYEPGGPDAETIEIPPRPGTSVDPLATAVGRASIPTVGDVIDAMLELGLLLREHRSGVELMIINPAPQPAWERLGLDPESTRVMRSYSVVAHRAGPPGDLMAAVRWMGDRGLRATKRQLAVRWSTPLADIDAALRSLIGLRKIVSDREIDFDSDLDADDVVVLKLRA